MKFFLLKMVLSGIKNIDKEIEINFFNNTLTKKFDPSNSHVKAIYGANGAGKTGIMYAVDIYKNLVGDPKYLTVCNANGSLDCLINQNTHELKIKMVYRCAETEDFFKIYSHLIRIKKTDGEFKIVEEQLCELSGLNLNNAQKYSTIYHIVDGEIVELHKKCQYVDKLRLNTMNLLSTQSFFCAAVRSVIISGRDSRKEIDEKILEGSLLLFLFTVAITVVLQGSDKFVDYDDMYEQINSLLNPRETGEAAPPVKISFGKRLAALETRSIRKSNFKNYEDYVSRLCLFIQVFNNDLQNIEIKKDDNGDFYECENILVYKDKKINEKYESTGIKKLIGLYSALCDLDQGKIVFIDEFDANLHDVLLEKLVQYIMQYSPGQFVFTTHNLGPMDVLQSAKNSIDFLSSDSRLVSWTKNGNYTAASQYRKGLIKYSPFNIEPFSFLGVFGDGQK